MENIIQDLFEKFSNNKDKSINLTKKSTPRVKIIENFLKENQIKFKKDMWQNGDRWLINIYIEFKAETEEYRLFDAHHDVLNFASENAQDNTCSVINLLMLAKLINEKPIAISTLIVFTDGEEPRTGGMGSGAIRAASNYKNKKIYSSYALELTGLGDRIWHSGAEFKINYSTALNCPFNNSTIYSTYFNSTCIGILPDSEIKEGRMKTWSLCHSHLDTFDKCSSSDMNKFVIYLYQIAKTELIEIEEPNDPFHRLSILAFGLKKLFSTRIKVNMSTDIFTKEVELLLLPVKLNSIINQGYFKITFENGFFLQKWDEDKNTEVKSVMEIKNILERNLN